MTRTQRTDAPQRTPHSRTTSGLKPGGIGLAVPHLRIDLEQGVFPRAAPARTTRLAAAICAAFGVALSAPTARGQQMVTPAIADSPTAQTLMGDLQAQARENPAESARIARRLLDEYGDRVVRVGVETDELFRSVGAIGKYKNIVEWNRLGQSRYPRVWEVVMTDPVPFRILGAWVNPSRMGA